jgi:flagellar export protein FliJ
MKTKFTALVDFRKQSVDKIERQIASMNFEITKAKDRLLKIEHDILTTEIPTKGTFFEISCVKELVNAHRRELKNQQFLIIQLKDEVANLKKKLKEAYLEYEKAKHLDDLEKERIIKERKQKESAYMDEIALMLHNGKNNQK